MGIRHRQRRRSGGGSGAPGSVRIIGGKWRGRRLPVPHAPGLRPSGDRVRETLFNWLQPRIHGARCADLFAGTGALGFEAASRGAGQVTLVERSRPLSELLLGSAEALGAQQVTVVNAEALDWLGGLPPESLDMVFIDPPFDSDLAQRALEVLHQARCLSQGGLVYLESPAHETHGAPREFQQKHDKVIGEVRLQLFEWRPPG